MVRDYNQLKGIQQHAEFSFENFPSCLLCFWKQDSELYSQCLPTFPYGILTLYKNKRRGLEIPEAHGKSPILRPPWKWTSLH